MRSPLTEFCDRRGIDGNIKQAFSAYLRSVYSKRYLLGNDGETVHLMISKMSEEQLEQMWREFVSELAKHLRQ